MQELWTDAGLVEVESDGGYGGPGRGGDSIGIAYLDEDQLTLEGVTYGLGAPGKGGVSWNWSGDEVTAEDGIQVETQRFPELDHDDTSSEPRI
ncbi:hypothetical protein BE17_27000 [Sorangium cellulosum]|uniref:Uncharacterized protein n=1 Tax=Sorangium cellulosum TaxID=56 RepID=A0A150R9B8_SORCE|nr:hypothetical protein BE17_27000 [Sorangium cellulosum]